MCNVSQTFNIPENKKNKEKPANNDYKKHVLGPKCVLDTEIEQNLDTHTNKLQAAAVCPTVTKVNNTYIQTS